MYQTTWFDQNIPYWNQFLERFKNKPITALEVGCFEGRATVWLLKNILTHPESKISVIDTFQGSVEFPMFDIDNERIFPNFTENIAPYQDRVFIMKGLSEKILFNLIPLGNKYDLIYIDGSHICLDVLKDGVYAYELLKPGGSIIFDDYNWNPGKGDAQRPHEAIQAFLKIWGGYYGKWKFWLDQAAFTKNW